ncbi:MAG: BLUF domain-containing protein [Oceanicaulis sp.]
MHACLYFSEAAGVDGSVVMRERLSELSAVSQPNNRRDGLTGVLVGSGDAFLQYVEGPRAPLAALMERIYADARHRRLVVAWAGDIETRSFANWAMAPIQPGRESASRFDYAMLAEEGSGALMRRLADIAARSEKIAGAPIELGDDVVRL